MRHHPYRKSLATMHNDHFCSTSYMNATLKCVTASRLSTSFSLKRNTLITYYHVKGGKKVELQNTGIPHLTALCFTELHGRCVFTDWWFVAALHCQLMADIFSVIAFLKIYVLWKYSRFTQLGSNEVFLFIWLRRVLVTWDLQSSWHHGGSLVPAPRIFFVVVPTLSYSMKDLVPWPGIKPGPPALGTWESLPLDHQGSLLKYF